MAAAPSGKRFLAEYPDFYVQKKNGSHENIHDVLKNKRYVILYFSAHWCPPCQRFTPLLKQFYNNHRNMAGKEFEVIFISSDRSEKHMMEYFSNAHGDWYAVPFADLTKMGQHLSGMCRVNSIPHVVVLEVQTGRIITRTARHLVAKDPQALDFPWEGTDFVPETGKPWSLFIMFAVCIVAAYFYFSSLSK